MAGWWQAAILMTPDWPGLSFLGSVLAACVAGILIIDRLRTEVRILRTELAEVKLEVGVLRGIGNKNSGDIHSLQTWQAQTVAVEHYRAHEGRS